MAIKIRLARFGAKKRPFYRVVVADSREQRDGKYIEKLGFYDPRKDPPEFVIDKEKTLYWLKQGAIPTETVKSFIKKRGILKEGVN